MNPSLRPARWSLVARDARDPTIRLLMEFDSSTDLKILGELPFPVLRAGTKLELRVQASAFVDQSELAKWLKETECPLFPAGEQLRVRIRPRVVREDLRRYVLNEDKTPEPGRFVAITLQDPLRLICRKSSDAKLSRAKCRVPGSAHVPETVNEAYRIVSEMFEPHRRSHSGNVFQEVFYHDEGWWLPLDAYRCWIELGNGPLRSVQTSLFEEGK